MNCLVLVVLAAVASQAAQPSRPPVITASSTPWRGTSELGKGWAALAAGRVAEAEAAADQLLRAGTRRHDALALKVAARVQAGRAEAALDAYEEAMRGATVEDVYLLQPIARGVLDALTRSVDSQVRIAALGALGQAGDRDAAARLAELSNSDETGAADLALAELKNPRAIARLEARVKTPNTRADVSSSIDALVKAKATSAVPAIVSALDPSRPVPTRLSAARALGQLGAKDAIPQLQGALRDPDPAVQMVAAAALSRLGDRSGADLVQIMENSPIGDVRLMLAENAAPQDPAGSWVGTATKVLADPDPLARLSAAGLIVKYGADPRPGVAVLTDALSDPNPAMRFAASRHLGDFPTALLGNDLASLRRWLRDPDAHIRVAAAASLLRLAGGIE